jgi:parallel beta-helix repeat protein
MEIASSKCNIESNTAFNNEDGIILCRAITNTITNNTISNNYKSGITLYDSCNNNTLTSNTALNNRYGIHLKVHSDNNLITQSILSDNQYGIFLDSSNKNEIYLNNFLNNDNNVVSSDSTSTYNSPSKMTYTYTGNTYTNYLGNYWDDYTGSDTNNDGIGDIPYPINSDNDNYPLMVWFENYIGMPESPWPMFQHDPQHTGRSPYVGPPTHNIKWIFKGVKEAIHGPSVADDGTIYLAASTLYAISPEGELKWQHQAGGVNAPVVRDGMAYVVAYGGLAHGGLFAFDSEGILKWNKTLAHIYMAVNPTFGSNERLYYVAGCVLPDGLIHCCLIALDLNGEVKWIYDAEEGKTYDKPDFDLAPDGCQGGVDPGPACSPSIGPDGTIYFGWEQTLIAIYPDGQEKWQKNIGHSVGTPTISPDGTIYTSAESVYAISPDNETLWSFHGGYGNRLSPALGSDGTLYVPAARIEWPGIARPYLSALDSHGNLKWEVRLDGYRSSPAVDSDGTIYIVDGGTLRAFDSQGNEQWNLDLDVLSPRSLSIGSDGTLYVPAGDKLYAIGPSEEQNPPIANAGGPYSGNVNEPIQFYGSGTDPDGDAIIAYAWDFSNDGITDSTLQNPTHSWSSAGTYYPALKVQDERGAWSEPNGCTVLITTPPSYDGALTGVHQQPNYMTGKIVSIGVDIKNTGGTDETYDLHLVVYDKYDTPVYDDTINGIYLASGAKTSREFSSSPLSVGYYSFTVELKSSSSGGVYDEDTGGFSVLDPQAIQIVEDDAESLKQAAFDELDEMVTVTSATYYEMVIELTWGYIKDVVKDKIVGTFSPQLNLFTGTSEQDLADAGLTADGVFYKWEKAIEEFGEGIGLKSGLKEVYHEAWTLPEETNIIIRDSSFDMFIIDKPFTRNDNLIQVFSEGKTAIQNTMESSKLQEEIDVYNDLKELEGKWWFHVIKYIAAIALLAAVIFTIVSGVGAALITFSIPILKSFLGALSILPKIGIFAIAMAMVLSLPFVALEVTIQHDSTLDIAEMMIDQQTTSTANVLSIAAGPQSEFDKETKFSMTIDKEASNGIEPIIGIVVSPDGRVIDMSLYQTDPHASDHETISSLIRLPHQPGKYKILAMTMDDMMKSSVKQVETTKTAPNVSVSISTAKPFYNFSETVTLIANFTNTVPEKLENLMFSIDVLNTTYNKTGFLEIGANSSGIETLSFVPETNGTYKATVTLFAGLYVVDTAETGFTVESGKGVSVNVDSEEVYGPSTNVTANLTIKNVGSELYTGNADISTVDTLNDYFVVYNAIESLSVNVSEEKDLQCLILPKESATPGIYRSYVTIDDSTYIIPFIVAANGTIFITVQTDKLIYSASECVIVNISVNDVAFNATNATLNMSLTDPYGNKDYFVVTGSNGNYSAIITPDHKSVNGTYTILVNGTKEDYRVYSDQTFFIVNERTELRCDIPRVIQLNTTDTINLFVETDTNLSLKDAFVTLTGCGLNGTRTTDEIGLVVFGTSSMNKTGVINVSIEKGGYGSLIGKMEVIYKKQPPIASFTYSPEKPVINQTITFNASNSSDPDGNITKYDWNFGDGNITNTTEDIINHTYSLAGDYTVDLTVTDNHGAMNSTEETITVYLTVPPEITSFAPPSQVNDTICTWRTFNVTVNQVANVSWYLNGTFQFTNESVREAECTLHAAVAGEHNVTANASNANGTDMQMWIWNVSASKPPEITSYAPESPVNDTEGATRTFNITINQPVNVSWQINGTEVQMNASVTEVAYTNTSAVVGTWNVSAIVNNANGTDMQTWVWTVGPSPCFIATAAYGTALH